MDFRRWSREKTVLDRGKYKNKGIRKKVRLEFWLGPGEEDLKN